ncbi:hypothetical protein ACH4FX_39965 [Streptomyces sp. NPDC018019]|uniref:hypothetical protein n=1 Tax=Streptomyces sp. NPDC018019 TaxID=3365030 RepID=UPI00378FCF85
MIPARAPPGHTARAPDTGDGRQVVTFGDAMPSPVQVQRPDWEVVLDTDRDEAERSRRRLVDHLEQDGVYGNSVQFADQQLGTVDDKGRALGAAVACGIDDAYGPEDAWHRHRPAPPRSRPWPPPLVAARTRTKAQTRPTVGAQRTSM